MQAETHAALEKCVSGRVDENFSSWGDQGNVQLLFLAVLSREIATPRRYFRSIESRRARTIRKFFAHYSRRGLRRVIFVNDRNWIPRVGTIQLGLTGARALREEQITGWRRYLWELADGLQLRGNLHGVLRVINKHLSPYRRAAQPSFLHYLTGSKFIRRNSLRNADATLCANRMSPPDHTPRTSSRDVSGEPKRARARELADLKCSWEVATNLCTSQSVWRSSAYSEEMRSVQKKRIVRSLFGNSRKLRGKRERERDARVPSWILVTIRLYVSNHSL